MLPTPLISDKRLVRRTLAGRQEAFNVLVERHIHLVQALAFAQTGNYADAQDATQETFVKAYQALDTLREPAKFAAWLSTIARRVCWESKRDAQRRRNREQAAHSEERVTTPDMERREMLEQTRKHLEKLPADDRELLMLRYYAGKRVKEIAGILGITPNTVAKRLQRAREALGEKLMQSLGAVREDERQTKTRVGQIGAAIAATGATWASGGTAAAATGIGAGSAMLLKAAAIVIAIAAASVGVWTIQRDSNEPRHTVTAKEVDTAEGASHAPVSEPPQDEASPDASSALDAPEPRTELTEATLTAAIEGAAISGRVYDEETDAGIADVDVHAYAHASRGSLRRLKTVKTDASGAYQFTGLTGQSYKITIGSPKGYPAPGESSTWPEVVAKTGREFTGVDFPLQKCIFVSGTVTDQHGSPLEGVRVTARALPDEGRRCYEHSKPDGTFRIAIWQDAPTINIYATRKGYAALPEGPFNVPPTGLDGVQLQMGPEGVIEGKLVDAAGKPLAGYRISARPRPFRFSVVAGVDAEPTAEDGAFRIGGLYPANWRIDKVSLARTRLSQTIPSVELAEPVSVALGEGETVDEVTLVLALPPNLTISGRVTSSSGEPIARAEVRARGGTKTLSRTCEADTDLEGRYRIEGLASETCFVSVRHLEYASEYRKDVPAGCEGVDFVLRKLGALNGQVVDALTGKPIRAFTVNDKQFQDAEGRFHLANLALGTPALRIQAEGYAPKQMNDIEIKPGDTTDGVVIGLAPGLVIEGVVYCPEGKPASNTRVYFDELPMDVHMRKSTFHADTNPQGEFTIASVPDDATTLWAVHPRFGPGQAAIPPRRQGKAHVEIRLQPPATLTGVVRAEGVGVPGVAVQVGEAPGGEPIYAARTDEQGRYSITGLGEGVRIVEMGRQVSDASPPYRRRVRMKAVLQAGTETRCDADFTLYDTYVEGRMHENGARIEEIARLPVMLDFYVYTGEDEWERFTAYADADGYFALRGVPPGPATVRITPNYSLERNDGKRRMRFEDREVVINDGAVTTLDLDYSL